MKIWRIKSSAEWARSSRYAYIVEINNMVFGTSDHIGNYYWSELTRMDVQPWQPPSEVYEVLHDADS